MASALSLSGCKKPFNEPTLADDIRKKLLFAIQHNPAFGGRSFGDVWNDVDLMKLAIRLINRIISEHFYGLSYKTWATWAGLNNFQDLPDIKKVFRNWIFNIATDQLYREYLDTFAQGNFLEYKTVSKNENIRFDNDNTPGHQHQGLTWALPEIPYYDLTGHSINYNDIDPKFKKNRAGIKKILEDPSQVSNLKRALRYSFSDHLLYGLVPQVIDNIITPTFLKLKALTSYVDGANNTKVFVNRYSSLFATMMNWSVLDLSSPDIKSNFLMVWEYQVKNEHSNEINQVIKSHSQGRGVLTGAGWTPKDYANFIDKQFHHAGQQSITEYNRNGSDPVFGIPHFKGFVAYDNTGKVLNKFTAKMYGEQLKKTARAGFLSRNGDNYNFLSQAGATYATYAYALPIYVPDILAAHDNKKHKEDNGSSLNFGGQHQVNVELKNYLNGDAYPEDLSWTGLGTSNGRSVNYLAELQAQTSGKQAVATLGTYAADGETALYDEEGVTNPNVEWTNFDLLKWAIYSFGQNGDFTKLAKTRFYSIAFNYDRKNLYSQKLFDEIGKYIEEKK